MNVKPEDPTAAVDSTDGIAGVKTIAFHISVFLAAFLVVFSRRPDAILNAQFWAEDGKFWYADAYHFGAHSLLMAEAVRMRSMIEGVTCTPGTSLCRNSALRNETSGQIPATMGMRQCSMRLRKVRN